jgi:DNA-3-methyladenine glycosylase II
MTRRLSLAVGAPFHLEATVRVLQRRPGNLVDVWEDGRYRRMLGLSDGLVSVEVENVGTVDEPDVRFWVRVGKASVGARREAGRVLRRILGLDIEPAPLGRVAEKERGLRGTARVLRGMRPPRFAGLFEAFGNVVPFQQLSLEAGLAIVSRLVVRFGESVENEGRRFHSFPAAEAIAGARLGSLRACGLSASKARTLREVARAVESGALTEESLSALSSEAALARLRELPGIGPWSAALVLLRGLGRLDVFPPGDVGAQRGLRTLMQLAPDAPLEPVIDRFGEYRGYLYFCALGGWLASRGFIHAPPARGAPALRRNAC